MNGNSQKFDLEEQTALFGENVIKFARLIPKDEITKPLISQIIRSGTSIGANYMEADGAESRKDFVHKMGVCKKECKETKHWLRMIATADLSSKERCKELWRECQELTLIFSTIIKNTKENKR